MLFVLLLCFFTQDNAKDSLKYENIELLPVPSTSQINISLSTQNHDDNDDDVDEDTDAFTTRQLFSFAWQIAKGMVMNFILVRR